MSVGDRWVSLDGNIHTAGECPSCEPRQIGCRCGGKRVHWQPVYGAIVYYCEDCDEWQEGPAPPHCNCGLGTRKDPP